ncbi:MAG: hypothetical protein IPM85_15030, partial [Chitinophagaceae bacterium]|nr:hypothetical protein [Chitinophagaceae bacterium]
MNEYFETLQHTWTEQFKLLPIVETADGYKPVNEVLFFNGGLYTVRIVLMRVYELAAAFHKNIPVKDKVVLWSQFVGEWTSESLGFIGHEDLVLAISKEHLSKFDNDSLIKYFKTLILEERINFFSEHTLLPNLDGKFCLLSTLLYPKDLNDTLIEIGKILIPHSIERLIHKDFCFDFQFEKFNRKDFSNSVKTSLDEMEASICICLPETINLENFNKPVLEGIKKLEYPFFTSLLKYCKLNNNINSQSKPAILTKILSRYYLLDEGLIQISNLEIQEDNLDIRSARKILVQVFFNLLQHQNGEWVKLNVQLLLDIAHCNEDSLKEVYATSRIFPNQINQLKSVTELKRDIDVWSEIKELYNKVTK